MQDRVGLAERLGLDEADRAAVYYVAMLAWVGCTADSHELAHQFGDDLALRADAHRVDLAGLPMVGFLLRRVGTGRPPLRRAGMAAALVATGGRDAAEAMTAHCQVAAAIARRLELGPEVQQAAAARLLALGRDRDSGRDGRREPAGGRSGSCTSPRSPRSIIARRRPRRDRGGTRRAGVPVRPAGGGGVPQPRPELLDGRSRSRVGRGDRGRAGPATLPVTSSTPPSRRSRTSST